MGKKSFIAGAAAALGAVGAAAALYESGLLDELDLFGFLDDDIDSDDSFFDGEDDYDDDETDDSESDDSCGNDDGGSAGAEANTNGAEEDFDVRAKKNAQEIYRDIFAREENERELSRLLSAVDLSSLSSKQAEEIAERLKRSEKLQENARRTKETFLKFAEQACGMTAKDVIAFRAGDECGEEMQAQGDVFHAG